MLFIKCQHLYIALILLSSGNIIISCDEDVETTLDEGPDSPLVSNAVKPENNEEQNEFDQLPNYLNLTEVSSENVTAADTNTTINRTEKFVSCLPENEVSKIQLVNDTELLKFLSSNPNITNKETPASCILILFYSKYCPFSSIAAPHFNALPRAFPKIKMVAINAMWYHIFNAQNGVVGVPTLVLFHNGKPVARFNESEYTLELFSRFVTKHTGIRAEEKSFVTSADFSGPVKSVPLREDDMILFLSWAFIIACAVYYFSKSKYCTWIVETIQNTWRESEAQAQHQHTD